MTIQQREPTPGTLADEELDAIDRYWRAANYLTIGQIYLMENPLLREPLRPEHVKPRLLGHWGTSPGQNLVYAHVNRIIREHDANMIYLSGPGHGGPALVANAYLEGSYSEAYPTISRDLAGMRHLFRQFSTPGGVPSHVSVPTPGSIHEGGELGYVLVHAFGAAFDNPDLVAVAVVGDGEAETGPLAASWSGIKFLSPARDGAVLPILHLNGYKISGPTVLGREDEGDVRRLIEAHGYEVYEVAGDDAPVVHRQFAGTIEACYQQIRDIQEAARGNGGIVPARWPAVILRTPKGWTCPKEVDGLPIEGTFRAHQVPLHDVKENAEHLRLLEEWMRTYGPDEQFDERGRLVPELAALAPDGHRRMGSNPHANGGLLRRELDLPDFRDYALAVERPGAERHESTRKLGELMRDIYTRNAAQANFRLFCPDETSSNRLGSVFEVENRCFTGPILASDDDLAPDGRVMEILSEHCCQGWLEGYLLTGRHGLFATYEAFAMVSASMTVQHAKWLEEAVRLDWRQPVSSLNILLTSTCWRNDHNGFSHQGPGLIDVVLSKKGTVSRIYLPPDANCLLSVADHCLRSVDYVNLIVIDKQPQLQWLPMEEAVEHCTRGASVWEWASNDDGAPDVVLAAAGDIPTLEIVAAASWLRAHAPGLRVRVVNVVDLSTLFAREFHPHGMGEEAFVEVFTEDRPVVFGFHGYQRAIHELIHGRPNADRFHVRGFNEEGTTTTPFDMVVRNGIDRFHLSIEAIRRSPRPVPGEQQLIDACERTLGWHHSYIREHFEDLPEVKEWAWTDQ
jgi:xylulose-5-phosphate/fructose-6-phosphate phosphoketolase